MNNVIKVFVENWPHTKPVLVEWAPIFIAGIALIVSISSLCWANKNFSLAHRPYVWAVTHAYLDKDGKVIVDLKTLRKLCINAPAEIIKQEYSYVIIKNGNSEEIIGTENGEGRFIMYPADPKVSQETYGMTGDLPVIKEDSEKLIRKIRIDYKEVSGNRKYFFEAKWEFDRSNNNWKPIETKGN